ncbi:hypothetical protein F8M41_025709 [Gigaspora margarita]|uniref:F-box domain-containing protein n=1 Tax=Gigaspora margarita TaxID=4874 RepID=A0A8H3XI27_GIGMA|nr:hypothetical protein F8M41_025709 [Gigaspora margarita]
MCCSLINYSTIKMATIASLPDDILYIISKDLGFLSTLALRSTCRTLYLSFSDAVTFSHVFIPSSISHEQFAKLFSHLKSTNKLSFIHQFTFNNSQIKAEDIISVLENCENLQELNILGCKEVKLLPITTSMKNLYQEKEKETEKKTNEKINEKINENFEDKKFMIKKHRLQKLKKIVLTRCVGGKRHSLMIKKILEDLQILKNYQRQKEDYNKGRNINCYCDFENQNNNICGTSYNIDTISTISTTMSNMMPAVLMSNSVNIYTNVNLTNPITFNNNIINNIINNNNKNTKEKDDDTNEITNEITNDDTNDGIFQFQSCSDPSCELCTLKCAGCNTKYKYWDEFWIKCGWCKDRHFCGGCVIDASKKNVFKTYAFQFMRIKLCQMFDLPCPH